MSVSPQESADDTGTHHDDACASTVPVGLGDARHEPLPHVVHERSETTAELLQEILDRAPALIVIKDVEGRYLLVNRAFGELFDLDPATVVGKRAGDILPPGAGEAVTEADRAVAQTGTPLSMDVTIDVRGQVRTYSEVKFPLLDRDGLPYAVGSISTDITERWAYESRLRYRAEHDPLTGLLNRDRFEEEVDAEIRRAERYGGTRAVLALDLDGFKQINDSLGHDVGDSFLASVGELLVARLRSSDVIARLGGDEFAVLLPSATVDEARHVAEGLVEALRSHEPAVASRPVRSTVSIGGCIFGGDALVDDVLSCADAAMYEAKERGRDRAVVHESVGEPAPTRTDVRVTWPERIGRALDEDRLVLFAQPIIDLRTHEVAHHELLVRMLDEQGAVLAPAVFLASAERSDLIQAIDRWVVRQAVAAVAEGPDLTGRLHVNVSVRSLRDDGLLDVLEEELERTGAAPERLVFELSERSVATHQRDAARFSRRLHALGAKLALEHFGGGLGSFAYVEQLSVDAVKIDGDLVRNLAGSRVTPLMVASIVSTTMALGCTAIAELVETDEVLDRLTTYGVGFAQGFRLGSPKALADLPRR